MVDDDLIRRGSVLERLELAEHDAEERDWRSGANEIARLRKYVAALPAAPAEDVRAGNRVTYNDDGTLDEIVTDAGVHLEDLGGNRWFLGAARSDGTEIRVWIRGKVTLIEEDAKEQKP